jgi:hypothetical protein
LRSLVFHRLAQKQAIDAKLMIVRALVNGRGFIGTKKLLQRLAKEFNSKNPIPNICRI